MPPAPSALPVGLAGQQQVGGADPDKPPKKAHSWPLAAVQHQGPRAPCSTSHYLGEPTSDPLHLPALLESPSQKTMK